ncbi:ABC transporter substrate-binding protein [Campylobacter canadensis]|uniref:ABC transporter substrate-binding protein n=1 Tax=Campylobacter canadensis TaxID=449520 RepID=UPI0015524E61|nr:ABC transporter substrate-binding protein [Campylobacter canadensis]MBZ7995132.1 ABC transporter substrate-binding protein [Campylobacter canadensis]MBZ7996586.1 ABC transporter substrate-binding protein [Campylobacter canadensis]MBZ8000501.1 ABC transporter substrate-binding protein [Campylobacter canadensis]MBZ8001912.1 ABC transporter substrate-binding protein [Campylobacter canadensis]MBZ8004382.1 ABC transporter substrate-binding protein [Campylobacter canadensis]
MKRREFLNICAAGLCVLNAPNLFANNHYKIFVAPSIPSITIAKAALNRVDTSVKVWKNPDELRVGVASNKMQIMMSPTNVCTMLYNKGFDVGYVNFLTTLQTSLISKNKAINELKQLVGKSIILPFKNDMPDIILRTLLKHLGIDFNKINFIYTNTPPEALALFLSKNEIDAAYLPEPMASAAKLKAKLKSINIYDGISSDKLWKECFNESIYQAGIIANHKFYEENKSYFISLENDLKASLKWILQNKSEAALIGANLLNAPQKAIELSINNANLCVENAKDVKKEVLEFLKIIHEYNPALVGGKVHDDIFLG